MKHSPAGCPTHIPSPASATSPRFRQLHRAAAVIVALAFLSACASTSTPRRHVIDAPPADRAVLLSEGYSLLHQLLDKNKQVSGIFLLKDLDAEFETLIRDIAETCERHASQLADFAARDDRVLLTTANLPEVEADARAFIESNSTAVLMKASGDDLRLRLALEQLEATRYAAALAAVLAENDVNPDRRALMTVIKDEFESLRARLLREVQSRR